MAKRIKSAKLIVNKLLLKGNRKDYLVPFHSGVNIIYGDSDTGKSSILNLINYCLGSKKLDLYSELEFSVQEIYLEVKLRGVVYSIFRNIFDEKEDIMVFQSSISDLNEVFPKYYSPNYSREGLDGIFSEFLMEKLNIPITKIKQSPSKEDSKMVNLSFRDIFQFLYLDQDQVGTRKIFGDNFPRLVKLKETFKLMLNILDTRISELQQLISEKSKIRKELNKKNNSITHFLRETQIETLHELNEKRENIQNEIIKLRNLIKEIDIKLISNNDNFKKFRNEISNLEKKIKKRYTSKNKYEFELKNNVQLLAEYTNDLRKISATLQAAEKISSLETKHTECPVCDSSIYLKDLNNKFKDNSKSFIKSELNNLKRRKNELARVNKEIRNNLRKTENEITSGLEELNLLRNDFDKQSKKIVTPFVSQRDLYSTKIGRLESDLKNLQHFYKIRNQQKQIEQEIIELDESIILLDEDLKTLKEDAPSPNLIFNELSSNLSNYLSFVGMKNVRNVNISHKTYLPVLRNKNYEELNSGGVRTLTSVGFFLSLMEYAINNPVNFPSFLMVDTIAKYIGKTKIKNSDETDLEEDQKEGMNDANKYEKIYDYLNKLHQNKSVSFQMIIVDNDIPDKLSEELKPLIVKHFTSDPVSSKSQIGLIDDAYPINF
ncbi:DUF3732 domain-containing protein [Zunongwangia sp.]|uniref:DUF3732 domain-containing protein n=1 Tax=Zunongwangia sp. TaxID=1965325 RepID=UPI003AA876B6